MPVTEYVEAKQHGGVQGTARSRVRIRTPEEVFDPIAKQEFVAENLLVRRKNRLAGDKLGPRFGYGFAFAGIESSGRGSHSLSIGTTPQEITTLAGFHLPTTVSQERCLKVHQVRVLGGRLVHSSTHSMSQV